MTHCSRHRQHRHVACASTTACSPYPIGMAEGTASHADETDLGSSGSEVPMRNTWCSHHGRCSRCNPASAATGQPEYAKEPSTLEETTPRAQRDHVAERCDSTLVAHFSDQQPTCAIVMARDDRCSPLHRLVCAVQFVTTHAVKFELCLLSPQL